MARQPAKYSLYSPSIFIENSRHDSQRAVWGFQYSALDSSTEVGSISTDWATVINNFCKTIISSKIVNRNDCLFAYGNVVVRS